jgi:hypothetical protein
MASVLDLTVQGDLRIIADEAKLTQIGIGQPAVTG